MRRGRGVNTGIRYFPDSEAVKVGTLGSLGTWSQRRNKLCSAPNNPVIQGQALPAEVCLPIYLFFISKGYRVQPRRVPEELARQELSSGPNFFFFLS